ncbi:hypothetical protein ACJJIU_22225 (plasmid) [Microbulbifer sp. CnH-101-E]|uniref:hypothetical protein n=1 Tax=unclassified Microbulbifer TaxID=2619833 RepID=UPI0040394A3E
MKERPILFNAEMVRAILDGRKTQTRRLIKPQPFNGANDEEIIKQIGGLPAGRSLYQEINSAWQSRFVDIDCPYGEPGDRLWVRETFGFEVRSLGGTPHEQIVYRASKPDAVRCYDCDGMEQPIKWKPSIHMPRWASRITLEITTVRVERIQDISEEDAKAEGLRWHSLYREWGGVELHPDSRPNLLQWRWYDNPIEAFKNLWESINGAGSWDQNPWVWVIEFRRVEQQAGVAA